MVTLLVPIIARSHLLKRLFKVTS